MKRAILKFIFGFFARRIVARYHPVVIGVTGSVGKTSTKNAIAAVLASHTTVRKTEKNLNSDIGLSLLFIGGEDARRSVCGWMRNIGRAIRLLVKPMQPYPRVIVAEMGADKPGDIGYLVRIAKPHIAVVTAIGDVPVHVGQYADIDAVIREKAKIVTRLDAHDIAILNRDDERVYAMRTMTKAHVTTFGFSEQADVQIVDFQIKTQRDSGGADIPTGVTFRLGVGGSFVPVTVPDVLGKPVAYACAAAVACAMAFDMNIVSAVDALADFRNEPGRMRLLAGVHDTTILDDTYNAAPAAMRAALDTFVSVPAKRKIAVLGDMLELGRYSQKTHEDMGAYASRVCDILVFIGPQSLFAYDAAGRADFNPESLFHFDSSQQAISAVKRMSKSGDVILIKGSQGMRMERITKALMQNPDRAADVLVRQTKEWNP